MLGPIRFVEQADHLAIKISGEFNEADMARMLRVVVLACADEGPKRLLVDIRAVTGEPPNIHGYNMAKLATGLLSKPTRLALFCTQEQIAKTFFETIAFSPNVAIKAFDDPQRAVQWLRQGVPEA